MSAWLGAVAAVVVGLLTLAGGIYTARSGGRTSPYQALADRVVKLEENRENDRAEIEELQTAKAGLERRVAAVISDRDDVVGYLVTFREWVQIGAPPPPPRVPLHLRNVIPDWMPVDEQRTSRPRSSPPSSETVGP